MKTNHEAVVADMLAYLRERTDYEFLLAQNVTDPQAHQSITTRYVSVLLDLIEKNSKPSVWETRLETMHTCMCGTGTEECPDPKTNKPLCAD